jgi:hypothetical protein
MFVAVALITLTSIAGATVVTIRSGNAAPGNPDPAITMLALPGSCGVGFAGAFTPADFAAAAGGPPAFVEAFIHPAWGPNLPCDLAAQWIGTNPQATPQSALFAQRFDLPVPCCFSKAFLNFCWQADDALGDAVNPAGIYINGTPIAAVAGGNYLNPTTVSGIDVASLLHCGPNYLYVYNRDIACAVSGTIYTASFDLTECIDPVQPSSWGSLKATYR